MDTCGYAWLVGAKQKQGPGTGHDNYPPLKDQVNDAYLARRSTTDRSSTLLPLLAMQPQLHPLGDARGADGSNHGWAGWQPASTIGDWNTSSNQGHQAWLGVSAQQDRTRKNPGRTTMIPSTPVEVDGAGPEGPPIEHGPCCSPSQLPDLVKPEVKHCSSASDSDMSSYISLMVVAT